MSTITKEFTKEQLIEELERRIDVTTHYPDLEVAQLDAAILKIALASLEAEAVAYIFKHPAGRLFWALTDESNKGQSDVMPVYTAPPSPVSVPAAMEMDDDFDSAFEHGKAVGWNAYRAAMLQGADGTLTNEGTIPVTQFKPVADLYGLTSPTGCETSFTFDAVEARDFIDGGWSCQEYVELERFQEAVSGNSPVIPDGWVMVPFEPTYQMCKAMGLPWESPRFPDLYKAMLAAVKK